MRLMHHLPRQGARKTLLYALMLLPLLFVLTGCNTPERIEITNHTDQSLYVQLALPYPAYEMFNNHLRYNTRIEPGRSWSTERASADERRDIEMLKPNGLALLRVFQYGRTDWSAFAINPAAELYEVDPVHIDVRIDADDAFVLTATDELGRTVALESIDNGEWFAQP